MSAASKYTAVAAALVALLVALSSAGSASGARAADTKRDRAAPSRPDNVRVTSATSSTVSLAWDAAHDNVAVAGYDVIIGNKSPATTSDTKYTVQGLQCGVSVTVSIAAFDLAGNRSQPVTATSSTAACLDTQAPTTPSGFRQAATTQNSVVLSWTPSTDNVGVIGYGVYRSALPIANTTEASVTLTGLPCGSTTQHMVDAVDAAGNHSAQATAFVQTASCADANPPTTPTGLTVTAHTVSSLTVSWTASTDDVGVVGYRVSVGGAPVTTTAQRNATLSGLSCGTTFTVGVDAYDAAGNRSPAATVNGTTDPCATLPTGDTTPPSQPASLALTAATGASVSIGWRPATDNVAVTGYGLYVNGTRVATTAQLAATLSNLSCATTYTVGVDAYDAAGNRSAAASMSAPTAACAPAPDTTSPSQPTGLAVTGATGTSVSIAWSASTDNLGVAGYGLYVNGTRVSTTSQLAATLSGLTCGTAYTISVDAYDTAGNRSTRADVTTTSSACPDAQKPTAPANVTATSRTTTSIALSWAPSSDNVGVVGYGLYRGGTLVGTASGTTGIFSGLTCNTLYTLAVDAYDAAGNRSPQTAVMVSTTACPDTTPPSTPTGLTTSNVTPTSLTFSWGATTDNVGVAGYEVFRNGALVGTSVQTSYAFAGLACGTSYTLAVKGYDAAGNRSSQASVGASTTACAPPPATCAGVSIGTTTDLQQAVNANPSGTTFCISPGVHRMSSYVIAKSGDSFVGSPGAVLNGSKDITALFTSSGSYWVASGQAQQGTLAGQCLTGTACQYPDDVFFDDRPLQRVLSLSGLGPGKFYFDYAADRIYIGDSPAGHRVEAAVATRAFMGWGTGADNVTISGLVIEKFANEAQRGAINGLSSWVVKDSEVRLNHGIGIQDTGTVVNNHVHDNGQLGMMGYALASGALIEGNEIDHNNYAGFDYNWEGGGVKIAKTNALVIRGNHSHDNAGIGLWCDTDCINVTYDNNRVINNKGIGILYEMSFAATIRNNVVEGNGFGYQGTGSLQGAGILLANSANVELYGNSVANNKDGMGMTQIDRGSGAYGYYNTHDNYFHNNTVTMSRGTSGLVEWEDTDNGIYYTGKNNRFQSNTYILHCLTTPFQWQNPTNPNTYASLTPTQWRADGNDTTGTFTSTCP